MSLKPAPEELVFLVRMWMQGGDHEGGEWRGSVQEVDSGRRFYVTGTRDLADFIGARMREKKGGKPAPTGEGNASEP